MAPGVPDIEAQERRDRVPAGTYARLVEAGALALDGGRRVPRVGALIDRVMAWRPRSVTCDRFRVNDLLDAARGRVPVLPRVTRWSEAAADIRALRGMALDGPLSCARDARGLLRASLAVATVRHDDSGNTRLVKGSADGAARDDVAAALLLAAGALSRRPAAPRVRLHIAGAA